MTRKDFELVASVIREFASPTYNQSPTDDPIVWRLKSVANAFAAEFAKVNPRFDRDRFLTACGF